MKYFTTILIFLAFSSYSQDGVYEQDDRQSEFFKYVTNPNPDDSLCIRDIKRAKNDINEGRIVFAHNVGFLFGDIRHERELKQLCEQQGLVFDIEVSSCIVIEGLTEGCYGTYMDLTISRRFGQNFKKNLYERADSLFLVNTKTKNRTVEYWDCDERPRLPNELRRTNDDIPSLVVELNILKNPDKYGGWPFFDLGFVVELDSTISRFYSRGFVASLPSNEQFEDELFKLAVQYIKSEYPIWVPGTVHGTPVRTKNNLRVFLKTE